MIDKKTIRKIVRDVLRQRSGLKDHKIMHPTREWFIGWFIAILFLIGFGVWCISLYWQYNNKHNEANTTENAPLMLYRESEIKRALDSLESRKTEYEKIKASLVSTPPTPTPTPPVENEPKPTEVEGTDSEVETETLEEAETASPENTDPNPSFI